MKQAIPDFVEKADYEKGFAKFYDEKIRPVLGDVEKVRLKKKAKFQKRMVMAVPVGIAAIIAYGFFKVSTGGFEDDFYIPIGIVGLLWGWAMVPVLKYRSHLKNVMVPIICDFFGNLTFNENGRITKDEIKSTGIFPNFTKMNGEDYIEGDYEGVELRMQELKLKQKSGKKNITVFKGLIFIANFNKNFDGETYVMKEKGRMGNWFQKKSGLETVSLEDPEFESKFEVYSTNQIEARYILTTGFMQRIMGLTNMEVAGRKINYLKCAFKENKMTIAISMPANLFEAKSINRSALEIEDIHDFLGQLNALFGIVKFLKLHYKIGL